MGKPKQVNKLSQKFESAAYEGVTRAQADGLVKGDLYIQTGSGAINIVLTT